MSAAPQFSVIGSGSVLRALEGRHAEILDVVAHAYVEHAAGRSVNPPSHFLTFPDRPEARIIALPAALGGSSGAAGIKWISSFPKNLERGLPRASAVLVLNDIDTGYPIACLESSVISATRTAASAVVAAAALTARRERPRRLLFVGSGLIARYIHEFFLRSGWEFDRVDVVDVVHGYAEAFAESVRGSGQQAPVHTVEDVGTAVRSADLIVFATTAGTPHVEEPSWFAHHPVVLHISLRDLSPRILLGSVNVLDDVDHCLRAETSPHLTEQLTGSRDFVDGVIAEVITGELVPDPERSIVFSPFGLGMLDLAVGRFVLDAVTASGEIEPVPGFFPEGGPP
ncbi:2,3-diaminopropionate biosynthesis protein SbnB [Rathayibacter tanaceti]|uniref:2,3-diaminopropionate biosynthesis protein SbnB n=2 Tax=Rathayibacter tanaceti TaxID=1671680 RepID=A0A166D8C3_9MICO|nr:2,3-diaminopropionate biosynthesis protein SbnB [Rathayibacter tanaceti]KZX22307.1 alanine dehydrogenase [Rathayibacter tanaceti]QHC56132.1 2,3-diaminopropionate biosynthesis protein SbnB [Rathayibacter tanaceti]TCO36969.1 ornithine cyclodeaminase [Rathayibacter tanaceti]